MTRRKQTKTGMPRTRIISLRVNEDEARELAGLAEQRGVTLSRFLIEAAKQAGDIDKVRQDAEQGKAPKKNVVAFTLPRRCRPRSRRKSNAPSSWDSCIALRTKGARSTWR